MKYLKIKKTVEILNNLKAGDIFRFEYSHTICEILSVSEYSEKITYKVKILSEETLKDIVLQYGTTCLIYPSEGNTLSKKCSNKVMSYYWHDTAADIHKHTYLATSKSNLRNA